VWYRIAERLVVGSVAAPHPLVDARRASRGVLLAERLDATVVRRCTAYSSRFRLLPLPESRFENG
jgi:hypothetical protein